MSKEVGIKVVDKSALKLFKKISAKGLSQDGRDLKIRHVDNICIRISFFCRNYCYFS